MRSGACSLSCPKRYFAVQAVQEHAIYETLIGPGDVGFPIIPSTRKTVLSRDECLFVRRGLYARYINTESHSC
jgi:hypothetical protein